MEQHGINIGHHIRVHNASSPSIWKMVEIELHPSYMKEEDSFWLNKSWTRVRSPLSHVRPDTLPLSGHRLCPLWAHINPETFFPFLVLFLLFL